MKTKFAVLSVVAVALACLSQQEASAWFNIKLKAGVDFAWQSGNNNYFWGLYQSGPTDAPLTPYHGPFAGRGAPPPHPHMQPHMHPHMQPHMMHPPIIYGHNDHNGNGAQQDPADQQSALPQQVLQAYYQSGYYGTGYYGYGSQNNSYYPNYGYNSQTSYSQQVPSYWFGY